MKPKVQAGKYVMAVSGGVDSVVLLDVLAAMPDLDLVVAHFDHGIRPESADDAEFVQQLAQTYGLPFVTERTELGANASENVARTARYKFLRRVQQHHHAQAIIMAHHQDDVLETAIFNMLRGTGRHGLTSLQSRPGLLRPLLHIPKQELIAYATQQKLSWREDTTNHDERYARNYIRHRLLVKFDHDARQQLLAIINRLRSLNAELDQELAQAIQQQVTGRELNRRWFNSLPHGIAKEVMISWLRSQQITDFDAPTIERLVTHAKTKAAGKQLAVRRSSHIIVSSQSLALQLAER